MKIRAVFFVCLLLMGCNRPLTKGEEFVLETLAIVGVGYAVYKGLESLDKGNEGGGGGYVPTSPPVCRRGDYQGCCSHHGGLLGCINYRIICQDETESPTCTCPSDYCVFAN